ncbi:MAG TPA: Gfo/Idh/MocA family oxidoreductase [Armatimonadota bacterium]|nr:Gfo/Idh/MocA family oxidoreductase [Armatimonadota bacterium]
MADRLRVVLAGCGGMSGRWLTVAKQRPDVEIVGLIDLREEAAHKRRDEFDLPGAAVGDDVREMLERLNPDVVLDCTIPSSHVMVTLEALAHGCHVMGEKPLADSMENARRSVAAAKQSGKLYAVMQNRRYDSRIRGFLHFLDSGQLGDLTTLNSDFYIGAHFGGFRDHMEHVLLLDMAIHTFDQARLISGADPVAVYCHEWNPTGSWYDHDASAICVFEMTGDVIYTYRGSWCAEGLSTTWECDWRAIGTKGSATWNGANVFRAQAATGSGAFHSELTDLEINPARSSSEGGHAGAINEFLDCVHSGETPETVCTDNIKSLAMVFGAIESASAHRRVEISLE